MGIEKRMKTKDWKDIFIKTKTIMDYLSIIGIIYILLYQIKALRKIGKAICIYIMNGYSSWSGDKTIHLSKIVEVYFAIEVIFKVIICLSISLMIILMVIRFVNDYILEKNALKAKWKSRFEVSLFRYLYEDGVPRSFLVTGRWGSGKTYEVNQFFDKYYKLSNRKVYKISCFGLSTRKELVEEIKNIIEQQDNSFYALTIKVLSFLPVIGEAIGNFLKKNYGYDSEKSGSVFIFDDFERITSRAIHIDYSDALYHKSPFLLNHARGGNSLREFADIEKEFTSVQKAFNKVNDLSNRQLIREDYDKYIAVVGLINELIETYGMKVIIVCNSEILGERFVHDVLRSKLNCIEYKKTISKEAKESVLLELIKMKELDDKGKQECLADYLDIIKEQLEQLVEKSLFSDLRLYSGLLEAFIHIASMFQESQLSAEFLNSLLNSVIISHTAYYNNSFSYLKYFENGADIDFMNDTFGESSFNLIRPDNLNKQIKWVDVRVSGYWIFNLSRPNDLDDIFNKWNSYAYLEVEKKILNNYTTLSVNDDYKWYHLLCYQKKEKNQWLSFSRYLDNLKEYDYTKIDDINKMLEVADVAFKNSYHKEFENDLFRVLADGHAVGEVLPLSEMHRSYITYLKRGGR